MILRYSGNSKSLSPKKRLTGRTARATARSGKSRKQSSQKAVRPQKTQPLRFLIFHQFKNKLTRSADEPDQQQQGGKQWATRRSSGPKRHGIQFARAGSRTMNAAGIASTSRRVAETATRNG